MYSKLAKVEGSTAVKLFEVPTMLYDMMEASLFRHRLPSMSHVQLSLDVRPTFLTHTADVILSHAGVVL